MSTSRQSEQRNFSSAAAASALQRADDLLRKMTVEEKAMQLSALYPMGLLGSEGPIRSQLDGHWRPDSKRWIPAMQRASGTAVLLCIVAFAVIGWPQFSDLMDAREGTIPALALITLIGLAAEHTLGGPDGHDRTVLAFASVSRHPGVAIVVANLTDQTSAPVGVLLAVVITEMAAMPYKLWRTRTSRAGPPAAAPPTQ
jgi:hypothetical protein